MVRYFKSRTESTLAEPFSTPSDIPGAVDAQREFQQWRSANRSSIPLQQELSSAAGHAILLLSGSLFFFCFFGWQGEALCTSQHRLHA